MFLPEKEEKAHRIYIEKNLLKKVVQMVEMVDEEGMFILKEIKIFGLYFI